MKKQMPLILGFGVIGTLALLLSPALSTKNLRSRNVTPTAPAPATSSSSASANLASSNVAQGMPTNARVLTPQVSAVSPVQVVTHSGKDFAWGTFNSTVVQDSLQLSPGSVPTTVGNGTLVSGTFISLQHLGHQSFDTIRLACESTIPADGTLKLDLRVLNGGNWSGWQELSPEEMDHPISINGWAAAWQYRLRFSAPSVAVSPRVQRVTVITRNSEAVVAAVESIEETNELTKRIE